MNRLERRVFTVRHRGRDPPRPQRRLLWALSASARSDAPRSDLRPRCGDRHGLSRPPRPEGLARRGSRRAARRLCGQNGDRQGPSGSYKRNLPGGGPSTRGRMRTAGNEPGLLRRGLPRLDFGHPLLGVFRPGAYDFHIFGSIVLHKICAGNHRLRIHCAHHWIVDSRAPDHVNRGFRLTIGMRQRGRAN
jgi:hypothetical protein